MVLLTPPPVPTSAQVEGQRDRRSQFRGAALGAGAAVAAAAIGIAAAVVGSLITTHAAADQSLDEFLRSQRVEVYAQLLERAGQIEGQTSVWLLIYSNGLQVGESTAREEDFSSTQNQVAEFNTLVEKVQLIGSDDANSAVEQLQAKLVYGFDLAEITYCEAVPDSEFSICQPVGGAGNMPTLEQVNQLSADTDKSMQDFRQVAQKDIGARP